MRSWLKAFKKEKKFLVALLFVAVFILGGFYFYSGIKSLEKIDNQWLVNYRSPKVAGKATGNASNFHILTDFPTFSNGQKNTNTSNSQGTSTQSAPNNQSPPTVSPPDNQWCRNWQEAQKQNLYALYQSKIAQENSRFEQELGSIKAEYARRGLLDSGLYQEAIRQATENHNNLLAGIDAWYQIELSKIEHSC
ncbi:MAG: hypothetical protein NT039_01300 [Candidatus Berkelbacteria bacterium]|nr:hypothetical protein [Candidatus Berkelbacteria bacterium]